MTRRYLPLLVWLAVGGVPSEALAEKVGSEFRVNTYTTNFQSHPSVASDANGNFIVVWQSRMQDGSQQGVFGQRFDHDGNPMGGEFQVNTNTTGNQFEPSVASDASGNFVVVWGNPSPAGGDVFGQRYNSNGNPLDDEFHVNTENVAAANTYPMVVSDPSGNFIVVWKGLRADDGVQAKRYDNDGNALDGEFQVDYYPYAYKPSVATDANFNFVVVWESSYKDGDRSGIFAKRYDSGGHDLSVDFQVNTYTTALQVFPSVASDANFNFIVTWSGQGQTDGSGVFGQRYDSSGNPLGGEFQVNTYTTGNQSYSSVASDASGNFVVTWEGNDQDGDGWGVFGQRYDSDGNRVGGEFQVNTYTTAGQFFPSVASDANGNFVVAWYGRRRGL